MQEASLSLTCTRRARVALALGLACTLGASALAAADPCTLKALAWMAGTWHDVANPAGAEERWAIAPGGVLMGSSWDFPPGGKAGYAELMTVRPEGDALQLVLRHFDVGLRGAWEDREAPMLFLATRCEAGLAVFEGLGPRAGERLTYERNAQGLKITGDFIHDGRPSHVEWQMTRS